jgi:hypothetical protein
MTVSGTAIPQPVMCAYGITYSWAWLINVYSPSIYGRRKFKSLASIRVFYAAGNKEPRREQARLF